LAERRHGFLCVIAAVARQSHRLAFLHASYGQRTERRERQAFDAMAEFWRQENSWVQLDHFRADWRLGADGRNDSRSGR
jgi:7-cyano-7-deazaguanine synthase in queuosine biosynthesis